MERIFTGREEKTPAIGRNAGLEIDLLAPGACP
jgi:hypothetical protein